MRAPTWQTPLPRVQCDPMRLTSDQIKPGESYSEAIERIREEKKQGRRKKKPPEAVFEDQPDPELPSAAITPGKVKSVEELKADFSAAFEMLGGMEGLVRWGQRDPKAFYAIWARLCIPGKREGIGKDGIRGQSLEDMIDEIDGDDAVYN